MPSLPAEILEHLEVRRGRMIRPAAAEVGLGDQARDAAMLGLDGLELRAVRRRVERRIAQREVAALVLRKGNEAHARIAVLVALAPGHRFGESLLAVKPVARREDEVTRGIDRERGPERLLDRLGAGRGPHDLFEALSPRLGLQVRDEPPDGVRLDPGNRVVGGQRDRFEVARSRGDLEPAHVAQEFPLPFDRVVTEVRDEHARRVVVQLAAVGGPVEDAGALGDRQPAWACRCEAPPARAASIIAPDGVRPASLLDVQWSWWSVRIQHDRFRPSREMQRQALRRGRCARRRPACPRRRGPGSPPSPERQPRPGDPRRDRCSEARASPRRDRTAAPAAPPNSTYATSSTNRRRTSMP